MSFGDGRKDLTSRNFNLAYENGNLSRYTPQDRVYKYLVLEESKTKRKTKLHIHCPLAQPMDQLSIFVSLSWCDCKV